MANKIQIRRNTTSGNAPAAASIDVGELAVNIADGNLWVGQAGASPVVNLVNPIKQLQANTQYTDGVNPNLGTFGDAGKKKIFTVGTLGFATATKQITMPAADGTAGQVLILNAGSTAMDWGNQAAPVNRFYNIPVGSGSTIWEDFNEVDWTGTDNEGTPATAFVAVAGETIYLTFARDGDTYIFAAVVGTNYGQGGTALTDSSLFVGLGGATPFATQAQYNTGAASVAVDPALGNTNYVTKSATGDGAALQTLAAAGGYTVPAAVNWNIGATNADGGLCSIKRNLTIGAVGNLVTGTMVGTLKGVDVTTAGSELTIDHAIIDGGTY